MSAFEERVLHKSVIVNILEMDESQSLFVALYRRQVSLLLMIYYNIIFFFAIAMFSVTAMTL